MGPGRQVFALFLPSSVSCKNSQDWLDAHGSFSRVIFEVRLMELGEVVLTYELINASFVPQWANPLWGLLEWSWMRNQSNCGPPGVFGTAVSSLGHG